MLVAVRAYSQSLLPAETPPYEGPFDPRRIPVELQSWWAPNFGHIHAALLVPLGQRVSGTLEFDVRIVLHANPSRLYELRIDSEKHTLLTVPLDLECPYDGTVETNCAFSVPVSLDTTQMEEGWRELRVRATTQTPDGKRYLNSSGIPLYVDNSDSREKHYNRWCGNKSLIGRGWYEGFGYTNGAIECVPLELVAGTVMFRFRAQEESNRLQVLLDKTHYIPAAGSWGAVLPREGEVLWDQEGDFQSFQTIELDTTRLEDGWHSLAVRSDAPGGTSTCSYCTGQLNARSGIAKVWFYVQNGDSEGPGPNPEPEPDPDPSAISLTVNAYKVKGLQKADLTWSGATSAEVDIYRDGTPVVTTANDGFHMDNIDQKGGGSYAYRVCEANTGVCSNDYAISF
jgi:hypothetical protein